MPIKQASKARNRWILTFMSSWFLYSLSNFLYSVTTALPRLNVASRLQSVAPHAGSSYHLRANFSAVVFWKLTGAFQSATHGMSEYALFPGNWVARPTWQEEDCTGKSISNSGRHCLDHRPLVFPCLLKRQGRTRVGLRTSIVQVCGRLFLDRGPRRHQRRPCVQVATRRSLSVPHLELVQKDLPRGKMPANINRGDWYTCGLSLHLDLWA